MRSIQHLIFPKKVFDGVKLFLPKAMSSDKSEYELTHPTTGEPVVMTLTFKHEKRTGDEAVRQLYNILFKRIFKTLKLSEHNRKSFDPSGAHKIPVRICFPCFTQS